MIIEHFSLSVTAKALRAKLIKNWRLEGGSVAGTFSRSRTANHFARIDICYASECLTTLSLNWTGARMVRVLATQVNFCF